MYPRANKRTPLTIRQETFVREYVKSGGNGADAALKSYRCGSRNAARVRACLELKKPHVRRGVELLRERMAKRSDITIEKILTDYQDALTIAKSQERAADMVSAATAQAKLVGLLRDRVETGQPGEFDHLDNISDIIEKVAEEVGPEAAQALMKALGYSDQEVAETGQLMSAEPASDAIN